VTDVVAGVAVHELAGRVPATPLLISHATGFHAHAYRVLAEALADHFHAWGIDHRGHGATPLPDDWITDWTVYGTDTLAVARHLADTAGEPIVGFGHSMGGTALLMAAAHDPSVFSALVLHEPIGSPDRHPGLTDADMPIAAGARRRRPRFDSFQAAYDNFASKPPMNLVDPRVLRDYVDYGFRAVADADGASHVELVCAPDHEADTFLAGADVDVWSALARITIPVTVIGSGDGERPAELAAPFARTLPNATFVYAADQTHFGPLSHPAEVAAMITATITDAVGH